MATETIDEARATFHSLDEAHSSFETALRATRVLLSLIVSNDLNSQDPEEGAALFVFMDGIMANMQKGLDTLDAVLHDRR